MTRPPGTSAELARLFGRLGFVAFGGPAAHIAMMHDEVVTRRRWVDEQYFVDMIGATSLIPGPNSTEMTMHVGYHRGGWRGLVVAGSCFILPAAAIVLVLAWLYVRYGDTPGGEALLYGIKPVVIVIIVQALVKLARTAVRTWPLAVLGVVAAAAYLLGVSELAVLGVGAATVLAGRFARTGGGVGGLLAPALALLWQDAARQVATAEIGLGRLFAVFLKVGAVLYGSGYVLLAFLRTDLVERLEILTNTQLLDAVAVGQFTPGPVFTTATFVGYLVAGLPGAVVATVGIFLPSFCFVAVLVRVLPRIRDRWWTAALLDGVNTAALGLMAGVLVVLGGDAVVDVATAAIAAAAGLALWRTDVNTAWLVVGGAAAGLLAGAAGLA